MSEAEIMGQRLQELRQMKGWSQLHLAEAAGVPVGSLRNWEQGLRVPLLSAAYRLARALGITLDALAGRIFEDAADSDAADKPPAAAQERRAATRRAAEPSGQKKSTRGKPGGGKGKSKGGKKGA